MRKFKKLLSVILAVMMVMSTLPTFATEALADGPIIPEGAELIFAEDFESGYGDGNLLEADGSATIEKNDKKVLTITQPAGDTVPAGYSVKVVDGEAAGFGAGNKVLELINENPPTSTNEIVSNIKFEFFLDGGNAIDLTSEDSPYYGKQLVYEFDAKLSGLKERQFMKLDARAAGAGDGGQALEPFQKATGSGWSLRQGPYKNFDGKVRPYQVGKNLAASNKTTFKVVFNQNGDLDAVRTYSNGVLGYVDGYALAAGDVQGQYYRDSYIKDFVGEYYTKQDVANMTPATSLWGYVAANNATAPGKIYLDNIKVYVVEAIEFDGFEKESNVNPDEGLMVKFNQPFNATDKTFKLTTTAGADVAGAIKSVEMADDNTAVVKMDFGVLEPVTSYKLWVDDEFTSAAGAIFYSNPKGITAADEWIELGSFSTCDKLEVAIVPASGDITSYDKGEEVDITLTFSTALAETVDFANAFTVTDAFDNEIEGLVATLNDDRTVGTLCLKGLELGEGTHTIRTKDGAIYNDGNVKAVIAYSFDTADFTAAATPNAIAQYVAGTLEDNEINVVLEAATTLTEDDIITAFDVTNASGEYVNGLSASIDATGKVIMLDISEMELAPGKYVIKSNEKLVDRRGRQLEAPVVVSFKVVTEISNAELIFEEDFENDYEVGKNWLANGNATETIAATNGGTWSISGAKSHADNFVGVITKDEVTDKNGAKVDYFDSNVLKIHAGSGTGMEIWRKPAAEMDLASQNKVLIYEFDMFTNNNFKERKFMAFNTSTTYGFQRLSGNNFYVSTGPYYQAGTANYGQPEKGNWYARATATLTSKHNVRIIVDQTKAVDSIRTYFDGEIKSAAYNSVDGTWSNHGKKAYDFYGESYTGGETLNYGPFKGIYSWIGHDSGATVYIDNFKAYAVNALELADVDFGTNDNANFVPDKGLTISFSEKISAAELKNNLMVKDAEGNTVAGAIRSAELLADGKSALVKLDFSRLEKLTNYDIYLSFLFTSKDGAYIARDGIVDGGDVHIANITTSDKLEVAVDNNAISGYDKGVEKTVTLELSSALKDGVDPNAIFVVKDAAGNEIEGLAAEISADRKTITLQLSGLELGDGVHTIESIEGALVNNADIAGSVYITVQTLDFVAVPTPVTGSILNYVEGTEQEVMILLTTKTALAAGDISKYFEVKDSNGNAASGLKATLAADQKTITLDISNIALGLGEHTIKAKDGILDLRGRELSFEYKFGIMPYVASYEPVITGYVPGAEYVAEIDLTYPLNAASIANLKNAFVVKNQYGNNVSGLTVTTSADAKKILLNIATLDITGGTYVIASRPNAFINVKGEILADVVIDLTTSASIEDEGKTDKGVGPNSGAEFEGEFTSSVLLSENFDDEGYTRNMNWLSSSSFVPAKFQLTKVGKAADYVDASVSIVEDPLNPGNYVLKNVAGFRDATGAIIAGTSNYHKVKRELDAGTTSIPVDDYTVVKLSTKVMIPNGGGAGIPTSDSGTIGNTKDYNYIVALTNDGTTSLNHANLRQSSGTIQYNSWINAADSATGNSGTASAALSSGQWHTVELIFGYNDKKAGTKFKSYEIYVDGKKITTSGGFYAANGSDYSTIGGMMSQLLSATGSAGPITVYYDDWSIVKMNRLLTQVNVPKEEVVEGQEIRLQLTGKLTDDSVALIEEKGLLTLKDDEGNDVDATVTFDNTGINTKVEIIPTYGLEYQTDYTIEIAKEYVDAKGNVSAVTDTMDNKFDGFVYTFTTAKALGNSINMEDGVLSYDADFMHNEDSFNYTMVLNEAVDTTPIIGAVATFNEDNKLLGIDYKVFAVGEKSKEFTVSSELGTKAIKLFIWEQNADGTMGRLMQIPDEVTSR